METIKQCYQAYIQSPEYQQQQPDSDPIDDVLETAKCLLIHGDYLVLEQTVNAYCDELEELAFIAGFRFATKLWMEGTK